MQFLDQVVDIVDITIDWVNTQIVADIISHVDTRGGKYGTQPNNIDAERLYVRNFGRNAGQCSCRGWSESTEGRWIYLGVFS